MKNKRLTVIAIESTIRMSEQDELDFIEVLELLRKKYNFNFAITTNYKWVESLAQEMKQRGLK